MASSQWSTMEQPLMDGGVPFIQDIIIRNILTRLPVKSLIRFQCVCKYWKYVIKTPSFIAQHLHHSTQNPSLLLECYGECLPVHLFHLNREMRVTELLHAPLIDSFLHVQLVRIVDSCHGLLCVQLSGTFYHFLTLLNPAIKQIRWVPKALYCSGSQRFYVGFGFSPIVNDYRIVRIYVSMHHVNKVEVFSLSTGSWREVGFGNLDCVGFQSSGFNANGAIFWFGVKMEGQIYPRLIVSFDLATEVFTLIPMPDIGLGITAGTRFTMYEHKLAILYPYAIGNNESFSFELWVMDEGTSASGQQWSWTKKYTSSPNPRWLGPDTIWRNEFVCTTDLEDENDEQKTVLCNPATGEFKMLDIRGCGRYYRIFNHAESLVPIDS